MNSKFRMETYFSGDLTEWLSQIPEEIIDDAVKVLGIDPAKSLTPSGYSPVPYDLEWMYTAKMCLWKDLVHILGRWGKPSPSRMDTAPSDLYKHSKRINKILTEALETLKYLEYGYLFDKGTMTKEFKVADRLRQQSEIMRVNKNGFPSSFVSASIVKQDHERDGSWGKYYPFDHELESSIKGLEKILSYNEKVLENIKKDLSPHGEKKKSKEDCDSLIWALCVIFKKYTGEMPISSAQEGGRATGKIIPFLKLALDQSSYPYETTDWALEKRIRSVKRHPTHGQLWKVDKDQE